MANPTNEPPQPAAPKTKPSLAAALKAIFSKQEDPDEGRRIARRRRFVMAAVLGSLSVNLLMFLRFFFPRALYEPKTQFRIGYPSRLRIRGRHQVSKSVPHLGGAQHRRTLRYLCDLHTPGLHAGLEAQRNKFKCPCHGSGYDPEGVNFEGPAPRPMDRAHVEIDPEGQIVVDLSRRFMWPKGERSQFNDDGAILRV